MKTFLRKLWLRLVLWELGSQRAIADHKLADDEIGAGEFDDRVREIEKREAAVKAELEGLK
jgi:hypothetical protein